MWGHTIVFKDFAMRSLRMAEESPLAERTAAEEKRGDGEEDDLELFQMRRTWESSPHPYIFFNPDHHSMTFLGFNIDGETRSLVDQQTGAVLETAIMDKRLQRGLEANKVPLSENFDDLDRASQIAKLAAVLGLQDASDPDETYELTTDNVKKMMAIYMRFRCGIPVLVMGETGCGKTRLVKFLCQLQASPRKDVKNMVLMKVHGGTTAADIMSKVQAAEELAQCNVREFGGHMYTVLFFDEANSTEAIGLIKEILCDGSMGGQPLDLSSNLRMVAACNPYRKHSEELIKRLEKSGLGYHVDANQTMDRLGRVPMRRLVYRVQPLPLSMLPLVWDFGQLHKDMEEKYIRQMVSRYVRNGQLPKTEGLVEGLSRILTEAQEFMRRRNDECRFVSLRDVERTLLVMCWFHSGAKKDRAVFDIVDPLEPGKQDERKKLPDDLTKSLILALAVCYRACLQTREKFDKAIAAKFQPPLSLPQGVDHFCLIIKRAQEVFMKEVELEKNIARNHALSENVFMMVVCTELRIPLFLVGKPGSSKSLAKTIVANAMQGYHAHSPFFKSLKQTHMVSFQCSPLSTADGILGTFRQCAQFQKDKNLDTFVSVVVLDEVGLAEDSPKMPLKTLHPLLEDGYQGDEYPEKYKKVAFIGISNWALDPAKMNRGILVQSEVPDEDELINSAEGICAGNPTAKKIIQPLMKHLAAGYLKVFDTAQRKREFFGLRDYYSLVKMICDFAAKTKRETCWYQLEHSIRRNFGGLDHIDAVDIFTQDFPIKRQERECHVDDPDLDASGLIKAGLFGDDLQSKSRYLLLLTQNYEALNILQQRFFASQDTAGRMGYRKDVVLRTVFGSSFPKDQEYTQICRNINKIKVCMEKGDTVILLNLENLYESLYDALNQYYSKLAGEKYVDLGLGTHRVKCRVHKNFRLIVVAEKQVVYDKFPIPLINRLEKHFLTLSTLMSPLQQQVAEQLHQWATMFAIPRQPPLPHQRQRQKPKPGDVFMGYYPEATAALVLQYWDSTVDKDHPDQNVLDEISKRCQNALLECATPDAVMHLKKSQLYKEEQELRRTYFLEQQHDSLLQYLSHRILVNREDHFFAQVTTHSKLLTEGERLEIEVSLKLQPQSALLLTLQSFDTEQQFSQQIRNFETQPSASKKLLLVQCNFGHNQMELLKCAQYSVVDTLHPSLQDFYVVFIVQLPRIAGDCFSGFQAGKWQSLHIDDLRQSGSDVPSLLVLRQLSPAALLQSALLDLSLSQHGKESEPGPGKENDMSASANESERMETVESQGLQKREFPTETEVPEQPAQPWVERPGGQVSFSLKSFHQLILSCLQAAVAMVQDADSEFQRPMERIKLLQSLTSPDSSDYEPSFLYGLCGLITQLLQEKEDTTVGQDRARDWLSAEAARVDRVQKAGTFRRAWMQYLESKVTPILGGIVAFLDTHRNLDLVLHQQPWRRALWLAILLSPETCDLHYTSLTSPEKRCEATKMAPHTTTAHGTTFSVQLPFSWLLLQQIDVLFSQNNSIGQSLTPAYQPIAEHPETLVSIVQNIPFCGVLMTVPGRNDPEIIQAYVHDFIRSKYMLQSKQTCDLLCEALVAACHQMGQQILAMPLPHTLVALHRVHREAEARLHSFLSIERVWPQVTEALLTRNTPDWEKGDPPLSRLNSSDELTLDVAGLYLLLNELEPQKEQLNNPKGRQQWLSKVTMFSPTLIAILNTLDSATPECGPQCRIFIEKARCLWTRILTVKLFVDHFFPTNSKTVLEIACMPLWGILGAKANFKTHETLEKVEKFLKTVNNKILKTIYGELPKCPSCETNSDAPLLNLPCKHRICIKCVQEKQDLQEPTCPECHQPFPPSSAKEIAEQTQDENMAKFQVYQRRCNSFLMAMMAKLCFAGDTVPESAAVEKILGYVTHKSRSGKTQTKQLTLFDSLVDPSPVVRSFLLQLLIRKSEEDTKQHLEKFFRRAQEHCLRSGNDGDSSQDIDLRELALLVLHCLEDKHHEVMPRGLVDRMKYVREQLAAAREHLLHKSFDLTKISALARCRHGLVAVAGLIQGVEVSCELTLDREEEEVYLDLLSETRALLDVDTDCPRNFLLKQLCRDYGLQKYYDLVEKNVQRKRDFTWLILGDTEATKQCQDRFLVCGTHYRQLRGVMSTTLIGKDVTTLKTALQVVAGDQVRERATLLALYRCVTMSFLQPDALADSTKALAVQALGEFLEKSPSIKQKELAQALLVNRLGGTGSPLVLAPGRSLRDQGLVAWLLHFRLLLSHGARLLQPLSALALQPQIMQNSLLPTMPEDNSRQIYEAFRAATRTLEGNLVTYVCPNGHPYVIGECGKPWVSGTCNECGATIGGERHIPASGNVRDQGEDRTETGYILGPAAQRSVQAVPERSLTPGACSLLRLLTHAALLLGAGTNSKAVANLVKPLHRAGVKSIEVFFWQHLEKDLEVLQSCLGKSVDDIFSLLHCLVEAIWKQRNAGQQLARLTSKEKRQQWETNMDTAFLTPVIQRADVSITELNEVIAQDVNIGQDRLLRMVYEVDSPPSRLPPDSLHLDPAVWRYRERITVAHFFQRLDLEQEAGASLEVLRLFRKECHTLQALHHVPELLQFQRLLLSLYHRRLDRSEALKIPIRDLLAQSPNQGVRLRESLDLFCQVWEDMKGYLLTYVCWTQQARTVKLPESERSVVLTPDSPCAFFLPSTRGPGLVAYILTEFLLRKHNQFMQKYCSIARIPYEDLAEVQLRNLTASHLVCLELERDLLPLVLANCNYSFQTGKGTQLWYDFQGFQLELVEQFLQSKARVHQEHHVIPIETMCYQVETTAAIKFSGLRNRVPQEPLSPASRHQISSQLPGLPEICQCLSDLDVAISFLQSLGGDPDLPLESYLVDVLRMASSALCSQKTMQQCRLKHVQSLWLLLCLERAKVLAQHRQEAFDSLGEELQLELMPEQKAALREFCQNQRLSLEKLECLLQQLFDCILLRIAQSASSQEGEDEAFDLSGQKLRDVLMSDPDAALYKDTENLDRRPVIMEDLANFPEDITGSQAARTWLCIYQNIEEKRKQVL